MLRVVSKRECRLAVLSDKIHFSGEKFAVYGKNLYICAREYIYRLLFIVILSNGEESRYATEGGMKMVHFVRHDIFRTRLYS